MSTEDDEYAELLAALQASGTANASRNGNGIRMSICDTAADAIRRLISERDEAREALRPFVAQFDAIEARYKERSGDFLFMPDEAVIGTKPHLTYGDFRRARAALSPKPAKSEGE